MGALSDTGTIPPHDSFIENGVESLEGRARKRAPRISFQTHLQLATPETGGHLDGPGEQEEQEEKTEEEEREGRRKG